MAPSNRKYQTLSSVSRSTFSKLSFHQGLPNIGNICFLNSVLQQLFYLQKLREKMINCTEHYNRTSLTGRICQLFISMKNNDPIKLKKANLRKIQENLQEILLDYEINCQYDSFQTLMAIINEIFEENPEIQRLFKVQYTLNCQCSSQMYFSQLTIEGQTKICSGCEKKFTRKIEKLPFYLLCHGSNPDAYKSLYEDSIQKNINFKLLSKNIYIGNKESGHYYSICYTDEKAYKFNDETVTEYQINKSKKHEKCVFAIFQVTGNRKPKNPFERTPCLTNNRTKNDKLAANDNIEPTFLRPRYIGVDTNILEKFKNDKRITKTSYIPTQPAKKISQIERPILSNQFRFTFIVLIVNYFHKAFDQLFNKLKISFNLSQTYQKFLILPRFIKLAKNIKIVSSLKSLFIRKPRIEERQMPMILT